jgi:hypothetical protein
MTESPSSNREPSDRRTSGLRNHAAAIIALFALAVAVGAWFWARWQPPADDGLGASHGVMVIGAGTFVAALVAAIRSMSLLEVLELIWELFLGLLAAAGAVLRAIWDWILGLFGLD